jgi:hypothetical protein
MGFFHGDIKPANIFYEQLEISSDAGSLLYIDGNKNEEKFLIKVITKDYSSSEHIKAFTEGIPRTR